MRFSTTVVIDIDVPENVEKEIKAHPDCKLGLCDIVTEDMVNLIKENVQAVKNLKVKGQTIIKDFSVV